MRQEGPGKRCVGRLLTVFPNVVPEDTVLIPYCYVTNQPPIYWFRTVTTLFSLCFSDQKFGLGSAGFSDGVTHAAA